MLASEPTEGLHAGTLGIPPIHGVFHVLNSRIFVKQRIQPRHWILKQLLRASATEKVHWALPEVLTSLADFCVTPKGTALSGNEQPPRFDEAAMFTDPLERISEESIAEVLGIADPGDGDGAGANVVAQVLLVFYVLTFNRAAAVDRELQTKAKGGEAKVTTPAPYSESFTRGLPVNRLVRVAESNPTVFEDVFPTLLALALDTYPELFHTLHAASLAPIDGADAADAEADGGPDILLARFLAAPLVTGTSNRHSGGTTVSGGRGGAESAMEVDGAAAAAATAVASSASSMDVDGTGVVHGAELTSGQCAALLGPVDSPTEAYATLLALETLGDAALLAQMEPLLTAVLGPLGLAHPSNTPIELRCQDAFLRLWHRLAALAPQPLWTGTLWRLQRAGSGSCGSPRRPTVDALLEDPLECLRIDRTILRQPMVLDMVVSMLRACLVGSERRLGLRFIEARLAVSPGDDLHSFAHDPEVSAGMVLALYSAAVQILLELCLADSDGGGSAESGAGGSVDGGGGVDGALADEAGEVAVEGHLQEIRIQVCHFVHQMFIEKPELARLIHFQGYVVLLLLCPPRDLALPPLCIALGGRVSLSAVHRQTLFGTRG